LSMASTIGNWSGVIVPRLIWQTIQNRLPCACG
jgi:hypothetical protein